MTMRRFSSSYVYRQSNFVLLGCEQFGMVENDWSAIACVAQNIIQRGMPTYPSRRLTDLLGEPIRLDVSRPAMKLIDCDYVWDRTIKGSPDGYNPAAAFFNLLLPAALPPDKRFIMGNILPEALVSDMIPDCDPRFTEQRVDFFCPRANLVIEVDGSQHEGRSQSYLDRSRDKYLEDNGIKTVRLRTSDLIADEAARELCERFDEGERLPEGIDESVLHAYEVAIRTQIALVTLVRQGMLSPGDPTWTIDFSCDVVGLDVEPLVTCAAEDVLDLFESVCVLMDRPFARPKVVLSAEYPDAILDVSATRAWSEAESAPGVVYARNDYYEDADYFEVAHSEPIEYETDDPERREQVDSALEFFLVYLFGYDEFRPGQAGIIRRSLARTPTLGILPTGSGKSLCYQMACLLQPCISFVVCPIISLIQDQEVNAHKAGIDHVARIESQMDRDRKNVVLDAFGRGRYFFIWISPERFQTVDFRQRLTELSAHRHFGYAVIDEVHCLSEWGHDFRVSYLKLYGTIRKFCPEAQVIALTATASRNVLEDLLGELEMTKANVQTSTSLDRPELRYHIVRVSEQERAERLDSILDEVDRHFQQTEGVDSIFMPRGSDSICGIIFSNLKSSSYRPSASCEGVLARLRGRGIPADSYHADREEERTRIQEEFLDDKFTVMCATKAFGMGVNKRNIRYTIHNGLPWSIEAFYQEAGRAGRDPEHNESECYILYSDESAPRDSAKLFEPTTSVEEIIGLQPRLVGDLNTLFYLWSGNHEDLEIERLAIVETFKVLRKHRGSDGHVVIGKNLVRDLTWDAANERARRRAKAEGKTATVETRIGTQDALYKLAILGIVKDWTVDFNAETYDVEVREIGSESEPLVKASLESYIRRHTPNFSFDDPLPSHSKYVDAYRRSVKRNKLVGLIDALLLWSSDNIVYSRRRAIGNMLDLCKSGWPEHQIREYFNSYFRLDTESNDQLDAIVRDVSDINTWTRLFWTYELTDDPAVQREVLKDGRELAAIAALCDRYRESYHANIGLEWSTMVARLLSGTFSEKDVESQFRFVSEEIAGYAELDADELFERTLDLLSYATDDAKDAFGAAVVEHAPERALQTYKRLNDVVTLTHLVSDANKKIRSTWKRRSGR